MNHHTLGVLEFDKVVSMLVERTSFPPGRERASHVAPTVDLDWIRSELSRVNEARSILDAGENLPLGGARDVREAVLRSTASGAMLGCAELADVAKTLAIVGAVRSFLMARRENLPLLGGLAGRLTPLDAVRDEILAAIDEMTLEVRDGASRELTRLRRAIGRVRAKLDEKLREILETQFAAGTVQEAAIHIRNGRRVLPVKRSTRSKIRGIVHDQSASGATLFVEPLATVPLNNELSELAAAEREEVERILRHLTALVRSNAGALRESVEALGELDFVWAKARLSKDGRAVAPHLNREGRIVIRNGRHPVLEAVVAAAGNAIVPLNLALSDGARTLVISGPNAGGKTVALKTVGLLTLMAQSGLHVPADPDTEIAVFDEIYADIGDEQSIEQNLSTFSSHLSVLAEILADADERSLVLVDEMGAGTDPDEGASLAIAILEELTDRRVPTIASTHLGTVKSHVANYEGMVNGSMAFDPETLEPTFRFVPGIPGASRALSIAEALGLPGAVVRRARELRDADSEAVDRLLADLAERERRLEATLRMAEAEHERAGLLARDYEERLRGVRDERRRIRAGALAEARDILERARSLVEKTVQELKARDAARGAIKEARRRLDTSRAEVARELEAETRRPGRDDGEPPDRLERGMTVRVASLGREGELLDLPDDRGRVRIRVRQATVEVDVSDLRRARGKIEGQDEHRVALPFSVTADENWVPELHLRGMTTDEVGEAIERFVSAAIVRGVSRLTIVHGKGTGALRAKTHEVLSGLPSVKSFRLGQLGEGDTGVTIVELG